MTKRMEDMYYFYASKHIHDTLDAFIVLRGQHRVDGARLLVRPALETMLKLRAAATHDFEPIPREPNTKLRRNALSLPSFQKIG